jgi:hypothetical protein
MTRRPLTGGAAALALMWTVAVAGCQGTPAVTPGSVALRE